MNVDFNRQLRAGIVLLTFFGVLVGLHVLPVWVSLGIAVASALHILGLATTTRSVAPPPQTENLPTVALLVPCRNEALVVCSLVANLSQLDYPSRLLEIWIADDRSTDGTGKLLLELQKSYPQLQVYVRKDGAKAGKSAVLNELLTRAQGDMIVTFDADTLVDPDFLYRTLGYFRDPTVGAVQVRRVVVNQAVNFLTQGQGLEMLLDAYYQEQRVQAGGTGELRGNGQVLRRSALVTCGGWNEDTITDDLDLTFKLHLQGWHIVFAPDAPVYEEGVTTFPALWRQRCRWAEGGFQRYLDYGFDLMGLGSKSWDGGVFFVSQYLMPIGIIPDLVLSIGLGHYPVLGWLLNATTLTGAWGLYQGQRRYAKSARSAAFGGTLLGSIYLLHWLPVMVYTLLKMALRPKQLVWVKTPRQG